MVFTIQEGADWVERTYCRSDIEYPLNRWTRGKEIEDAECYEGEGGRQEVEYEPIHLCIADTNPIMGWEGLLIMFSEIY